MPQGSAHRGIINTVTTYTQVALDGAAQLWEHLFVVMFDAYTMDNLRVMFDATLQWVTTLKSLVLTL